MATARQSISLRNTTPEDEAFLFQVYSCTRVEELAMVAWTEPERQAFLKFQFNAQHTYYHAQFPDASFQVIVSDGQDVGRLYVRRRPDEIKIIDITVLPQHRKNGIGMTLINQILAEAKASQRPVSIWVEHFNPSQNLLRRLGFSQVAEDGYNQLLQWQAAE